jgi:hypothetical protein
MLARIFLIGSSWALLSLIVGLLVGRLIFAYQETAGQIGPQVPAKMNVAGPARYND